MPPDAETTAVTDETAAGEEEPTAEGDAAEEDAEEGE